MSSPFSIVVTGQSLIHDDLRSVGDPRLKEIADILKRADLTFTNLETTIYGKQGGWPLKDSYFGCSGPAVIAALRALGFNSLALANNHAFDLGPPGILSTLEEVKAYDFLHAGIGADKHYAQAIGKKRIAGRTFGLIAMDAGPGPNFMYAENGTKGRMARPGVNRLQVSRSFDVEPQTFETLEAIQKVFMSTPLERANYSQPEDPPRINTPGEIDFYGTTFRRADQNTRRIDVDAESASAQLRLITEEARNGTFVIAYLHHHHWEPNWQQVPGWVRQFARACIDAGAGIFVSHGAPTLQAIEIYRDAPIFYGLGNFLFHTDHDETEWRPAEVWKSVIAVCSFASEGRLRQIDLHPIVIGGPDALVDPSIRRLPYPVRAKGPMAADILEDLACNSIDYDTVIMRDGDTGRIFP
ncbi:CapA family protein [Rhizobium sp. A22-96]